MRTFASIFVAGVCGLSIGCDESSRRVYHNANGSVTEVRGYHTPSTNTTQYHTQRFPNTQAYQTHENQDAFGKFLLGILKSLAGVKR